MTPQQQQMRRPGPPMVGHPQQQQQRSQVPKKKRRYADKIITPEVRYSSCLFTKEIKVRELVPETQAYMDLLSFEQKLDATITRKKLDIQVALALVFFRLCYRKH